MRPTQPRWAKCPSTSPCTRVRFFVPDTRGTRIWLSSELESWKSSAASRSESVARRSSAESESAAYVGFRFFRACGRGRAAQTMEHSDSKHSQAAQPFGRRGAGIWRESKAREAPHATNSREQPHQDLPSIRMLGKTLTL